MENNCKSSTQKHTQTSSNKKNSSGNMLTQDSFTKQFQDFYNYVNPMYGIRAKKKTLYDLRFYIEEIYTIAFLKYTYLKAIPNVLKKHGRNFQNLRMTLSIINIKRNKLSTKIV